MGRTCRLARTGAAPQGRARVRARFQRTRSAHSHHTAVLILYEARRMSAMQRIYGDRWEEAYNEQTMLKEDDHGLTE